MAMPKPAIRPANPRFSSGPCPKPPTWTAAALESALTGRSHRSAKGKARLCQVIDRTREILRVPQDYKIGIVPASDTGAIEMAMWSLLGARPVSVLAWDSFGQTWLDDVTRQLPVGKVHDHCAAPGHLPDLAEVDFETDVVFTWNGTTTGVRVPNGEFIPAGRRGLTLCDATSAVFAQDIAWDRLDATTFSWQKAIGGEAAHGILVLSPRAVRRLESWSPPWPMPKIFRLTRNQRLNASIFEGATINTPSMLCVEDCLFALDWVESVGGLDGMIERANGNLAVLEGFVGTRDWVEFLARDPAVRSNTSVCLKLVDRQVASLGRPEQSAFVKGMVSRLEAEAAAFDVGSYRDSPPGLRIWAGGTVERADLEALLPWLDWAFDRQCQSLAGA